MMKKFLMSSKGLSLVELLMSLALMGIVSVLIMGVLVNGMNSFKSVNKQISLHDEANYIMTRFSNEIFDAISVETVVSGDPDYPVDASEFTTLIRVRDYEGNNTILGFHNNHAIINGEVIESSSVRISCEESSIQINDDTQTVALKMLVVEGEGDNNKELTLENKVSFVNKNPINIAAEVIKQIKNGRYTEITTGDGTVTYSVSVCDDKVDPEKTSCTERYLKTVDDKKYSVEISKVTSIDEDHNEYSMVIAVYRQDEDGEKGKKLFEKEAVIQIDEY